MGAARMSRSTRLVLLAALSVGVALVGIELMVIAVALPQILSHFADWTQVRAASWINGYLSTLFLVAAGVTAVPILPTLACATACRRQATEDSARQRVGVASTTAREPKSPSDPAGSPRKPLWALAWSASEGMRTLSTFEEVHQAHAREDTRLWVDLEDPGRELLIALGNVFALHPLVTEDILERNQRGKVELTGDALHIVMFALRYEGETLSHEIDIVIGERFLLTGHDAFISLRDAPFMRRDPGAHLAGGVDFTLWAISDWIVDGYFPVFDRLGEEIDGLQDDVMRRPSGWLVERLFQVRRELLTIRRAVNPQREIFNQLTNRDLRQIQPERIVYFRDVYDHLIRLTDELDSFRELVSTTLDIYLSQVNNNLSEIMKRLTAVTAVLAGAGALAGIFGMSEVGLALSFADPRFWMVSAAIVLVSAAGFLYARRIGWI